LSSYLRLGFRSDHPLTKTSETSLLTYLLMELSPSGGAANSAATQEFPNIYGTRRFIAVFTRALHWSLSWARSIYKYTACTSNKSCWRGCITIVPRKQSQKKMAETNVNPSCWSKVVGIATGYGLNDRAVGVRVSVGSRIFFSTRRLHRFWGPHSLQSNGYGGIFSRE
jgi:hypothetical protein